MSFIKIVENIKEKMKIKHNMEIEEARDMASQWAQLIKETRYEGIKALYENFLNICDDTLETLAYSDDKTDMQVLREFYRICGEKRVIKRLLHSPKMFIDKYNKMLDELNKKNKNP